MLMSCPSHAKAILPANYKVLLYKQKFKVCYSSEEGCDTKRIVVLGIVILNYIVQRDLLL